MSSRGRHARAARRVAGAAKGGGRSAVEPAAQEGAGERGPRDGRAWARAVRGAGRWRAWHVGQPVLPALTGPAGRLRAKPARSAAPPSPPEPPALDGSDECGRSGTRTVAPSRCHLPAQAASARSEAQRGGHGGWPTARATWRGCCVPRGVAGEAPWVARSGDESSFARSAFGTQTPGGTSTYLNLPQPTSNFIAIGCTR